MSWSLWKQWHICLDQYYDLKCSFNSHGWKKDTADQVPQQHPCSAGISVMKGEQHHCSGNNQCFLYLFSNSWESQEQLSELRFLWKKSADRSLLTHNRTGRRSVFVILQMVLHYYHLWSREQIKNNNVYKTGNAVIAQYLYNLIKSVEILILVEKTFPVKRQQRRFYQACPY